LLDSEIECGRDVRLEKEVIPAFDMIPPRGGRVGAGINRVRRVGSLIARTVVETLTLKEVLVHPLADHAAVVLGDDLDARVFLGTVDAAEVEDGAEAKNPGKSAAPNSLRITGSAQILPVQSDS